MTASPYLPRPPLHTLPTLYTSRRTVLRSTLLSPFMLSLSPSASASTSPDDTATLRADYDRYSATYDQLDGGSAAEALGFPDLRADLLARARGDVLESGIGTGLNIPLYPRDPGQIQRLTGLDLSEGMLSAAARQARALDPSTSPSSSTSSRTTTSQPSSSLAPSSSPFLPFPVDLIQGDATNMPFDDASFDTVVDTFSLCVYPQPRVAMEEMTRVLRPGGQLLLLAHTRSRVPGLGLYQDVTSGPVAAMGRGCVWNQDVGGWLRELGLRMDRVDAHVAGLITAFVATKVG